MRRWAALLHLNWTWPTGLGWKVPLAGLAALAALSVGGFGRAAGPGGDALSVERGRYLAAVGDCEGCHTAPGSAGLAGGLALNTPFGTIYSTNITPDNDTGIGRWSREDFRRAMKEGKRAGGQNLYPAMPYTYYVRTSDADVDALYDYLQTVRPVRAVAHANGLPFPLNIRFFVRFWNWLNFKRGDFQPNAMQLADWNRGAYIVNGPGHCGACHTPKTLIGGEKWGEALQGGQLDGWFAPDLKGGEHEGLKSWSADEIATYLKTGANTHAEAAGSMQEVVEHSTSRMSDADLKAIAVYLKSLPATSVAQPKAASPQAMRSGQAIYLDQCAGCHAQDGSGAVPIFPPLKGNPGVQQANATTPLHAVLAGAQAAATPQKPTQPAMPAYAWNLTDYEIASVLTYVRNSWGNSADPVEPGDVAKLRAKVAKHAVQLDKAEH